MSVVIIDMMADDEEAFIVISNKFPEKEEEPKQERRYTPQPGLQIAPRENDANIQKDREQHFPDL